MQQNKGQPLHKFVLQFSEAPLEVNDKDESAKQALSADEKACFKYLDKYEIPTLAKLHHYCQKFRNPQDELKIKEQRLDIDTKQSIEKPHVEKSGPHKPNQEPQKIKLDIPKVGSNKGN